MRLIYKGLLLPIIGLFILQSCDNPDLVGLDDQRFQNGTFVDTVTVWTRTEAIGKARTDNRLFVQRDFINREYFIKNRVVGFFKDPIFGTTDARVYTQVLTPGNNDFGEDPVLDSAVLVLGYTSAYGDTLSTVEVMVEELEESMGDSLVEVYSDHQYTSGQVLGSRSFRINELRDSALVQDFGGNGADTVRKEYPQLRIRLDNAYISEKILNADTAILNDYNQFRTAHFKGVAIRMNGQGSAGGGLLALNTGNFITSNGVQNDRSKLILYYRTNGNEDTLRRTFGINSYAAQSNYFGHEYAGTEVGQAINDDAYNAQESTYIQPLAGTQTRIRFPYLKDFEDKGIKVNKAELILSVVPETVTPYSPPPRIVLHHGIKGSEGDDDENSDNDWFIKKLIDTDQPSVSGALLNGLYDRDRQAYRFNITGYVQEVVNGQATGDSLFVSVLTNLLNQQQQIIESVQGVTTSQRVVIGGGNHPEYRARLKITYSE